MIFNCYSGRLWLLGADSSCEWPWSIWEERGGELGGGVTGAPAREDAAGSPRFIACQAGNGFVPGVTISPLPLLQPCGGESAKPDLRDQRRWESASGDGPAPGPSQ